MPDYGGHLARVAADVREWGDATPQRVRERCLHAEAQRDELADALRWIANNCKPYGPAQAHAHNSLRRCGLSLEFREEHNDG